MVRQAHHADETLSLTLSLSKGETDSLKAAFGDRTGTHLYVQRNLCRASRRASGLRPGPRRAMPRPKTLVLSPKSTLLSNKMNERDSSRDLTAWERGVLERLLQHEFSGREQLAMQIATARATKIDYSGSLKLIVQNEVKAPVSMRVPVEATARDSDGVDIHFLFHVIDGIASELEIYKDDGTNVVTIPDYKSLTPF